MVLILKMVAQMFTVTEDVIVKIEFKVCEHFLRRRDSQGSALTVTLNFTRFNQWLKISGCGFLQNTGGIEKLVPCYDKCLNLNDDY